jgi:hypothetical protein
MDKLLNNTVLFSVVASMIASLIVFFVSTFINSFLNRRSNRISTIASIIVNAENKKFINPEDVNHLEVLKNRSRMSKKWYLKLLELISDYDRDRSNLEDSIASDLARDYFGFRTKKYLVQNSMELDDDGGFIKDEHMHEDNIYTVYQLEPHEIDAVYDVTNSIITGSRELKKSKSIFFETAHCKGSDSFEFYYIGIVSQVYRDQNRARTQQLLKAFPSYTLDDAYDSIKKFKCTRKELMKLCIKNRFVYSLFH